jgi:hypothetical protein
MALPPSTLSQVSTGPSRTRRMLSAACAQGVERLRSASHASATTPPDRRIPRRRSGNLLDDQTRHCRDPPVPVRPRSAVMAQDRRTSATLHAWAMQPRAVKGSTASKISLIEPMQASWPKWEMKPSRRRRAP